jgi:CRISPR-associated protein Csb3
MSHVLSSFAVTVDMANPGQVIACCGVFELAHRKWPGAEGWFDGRQFRVAIPGLYDDNALGCLVKTLAESEISGLSEEEYDERVRLEKEGKELRKKGLKLPEDKEKRRQELGEQARAGVIRIGAPFDLLLDWWQTDDEVAPKTGRQELHKIARAAQDALSGISDLTTLLDYGCVLRKPREYWTSDSDGKEKVEPFYFDARRFAHALDTGFSLDTQEMETIANPAVELLCLIGLQRFRPATAPAKWGFDYWIWSQPLSAPVAAAVFSGVSPLPGSQGYRFRLRFRDDQKRGKAFGLTARIGGDW